MPFTTESPSQSYVAPLQSSTGMTTYEMGAREHGAYHSLPSTPIYSNRSAQQKTPYFDRYPERKTSSPYVPNPALTPDVATHAKTSRPSRTQARSGTRLERESIQESRPSAPSRSSSGSLSPSIIAAARAGLIRRQSLHRIVADGDIESEACLDNCKESRQPKEKPERMRQVAAQVFEPSSSPSAHPSSERADALLRAKNRAAALRESFVALERVNRAATKAQKGGLSREKSEQAKVVHEIDREKELSDRRPLDEAEVLEKTPFQRSSAIRVRASQGDEPKSSEDVPIAITVSRNDRLVHNGKDANFNPEDAREGREFKQDVESTATKASSSPRSEFHAAKNTNYPSKAHVPSIALIIAKNEANLVKFNAKECMSLQSRNTRPTLSKSASFQHRQSDSASSSSSLASVIRNALRYDNKMDAPFPPRYRESESGTRLSARHQDGIIDSTSPTAKPLKPFEDLPSVDPTSSHSEPRSSSAAEAKNESREKRLLSKKSMPVFSRKTRQGEVVDLSPVSRRAAVSSPEHPDQFRRVPSMPQAQQNSSRPPSSRNLALMRRASCYNLRNGGNVAQSTQGVVDQTQHLKDSHLNQSKQYLATSRLNNIFTLTSWPYMGLRVSFADIGDPGGHPVFVFLGLGAIRYLIGLYDDIAKQLKLRLICVDRWGLGRTDDLAAERCSVLGWSKVIREVADHLQMPQFSLLAHSAGAPYAMATSFALKERIEGPVYLLAPWVGSDMDSGYRWLRYVPDTVIRTAQAADWHIQAWRLGLGKGYATQNAMAEGDAKENVTSSSTNIQGEGSTSRITSITHLTSAEGMGADSNNLDAVRSESSRHSSDELSPPHTLLRSVSSDGISTSTSSGSMAPITPNKSASSETEHSTHYAKAPLSKRERGDNGSLHADIAFTNGEVSSRKENVGLLNPKASKVAMSSASQTATRKSSAQYSNKHMPSQHDDDFITELLRASHAECARGGSTTDLLTILGRSSQQPWGFSYTDVTNAVRVWHGEHDERVSLSSSLWMERFLLDCKVHVVKGADHNLMTNPDVMINVLERIALRKND